MYPLIFSQTFETGSYAALFVFQGLGAPLLAVMFAGLFLASMRWMGEAAQERNIHTQVFRIITCVGNPGASFGHCGGRRRSGCILLMRTCGHSFVLPLNNRQTQRGRSARWSATSSRYAVSKGAKADISSLGMFMLESPLSGWLQPSLVHRRTCHFPRLLEQS